MKNLREVFENYMMNKINPIIDNTPFFIRSRAIRFLLSAGSPFKKILKSTRKIFRD